jgi:hypothetical protein
MQNRRRRRLARRVPHLAGGMFFRCEVISGDCFLRSDETSPMRPSVHRRASKPRMTIMKKSGRNKNSKICFIYCCYCYILEIWFSSPNKNPPRKGADGSPAIYSTRPPARTADAVDKESGSRCGKAPRTWKTPLRPESTLEPQLAQKQPARPPHTPLQRPDRSPTSKGPAIRWRTE